MRLSSAIALVTVLLVVIGHAVAATGIGVVLMPVPGVAQYPDAVAPGALQFACAEEIIPLSLFFRRRNLPLDRNLLRQENGLLCHIFYEPTLPGFRVHPDDDPIAELHIDVDALSFLGQRAKPFGDPLDMAKLMMPLLPGDLSMTLHVNGNHGERWSGPALRYHFGDRAGAIRVREDANDVTNSWVQDYMKSGSTGGETKVLTPRYLWEGRREYGAMFKGVLDALPSETYVRSKLSWEGGDLQFVRDPISPGRLLLVHGDAAARYWAESLTGAEYAWVLRIEFGSNESIDVSGILPHADYFVGWLPEMKTALVTEPMRGDFEFARAALDVLLDVYGSEMPPELDAVDRAMSSEETAFRSELGKLKKSLHKARKMCGKWTIPVSGQMMAELDGYVLNNCPENMSDCFAPAGRAKMLVENPELLRAGISTVFDLFNGANLAPRMLSVIESQLPGYRTGAEKLVSAKTEELRRRGFNVVRVPWLGGKSDLDIEWPGISYANSALVGKTLFVPEFGLGAPEKKVFEKLQEELSGNYRVVPVYARYSMLRNGGTHCALGMVRRAASPGPTLPPAIAAVE